MSNSKHVLILGGSDLQVPMIIRANELGYISHVVDQDPNCPGNKLASFFSQISTNDTSGINQYVQRNSISGITTIATDFPMRTVASVASDNQLTSISQETAFNCTDKGQMALTFEKFNIPHPSFEILSPHDEPVFSNPSLGFPCIVKPVDASGSRGVTVVERPRHFESSLMRARKSSRCGKVIVQELLVGFEVSVELLFEASGHIFSAITDKETSGVPYFVETGHTQPTSLNSQTQRQVIDLATAGARALGIEQGPAHVEIMVTENGPKIIEIGARLGGDFITSHLVPLATGYDIMGQTLSWATNSQPPLPLQHYACSAIRYLNQIRDDLSETLIAKARSIPGIVDIHLNQHSSLTNVQSSSDRAGNVIAVAANRSDALSACEQAIKLLHSS